MTPLKRIRQKDPLEELAKILFAFIDDGWIKRVAFNHFLANKSRVREVIRADRKRMIELIEAI